MCDVLVAAVYCVFFADFGDHEHIFSPVSLQIFASSIQCFVLKVAIRLAGGWTSKGASSLPYQQKSWS
jgi:hypothetical protein